MSTMCPHCGEEQAGLWDLPWTDGEDELTERCDSCGRPFVVRRRREWVYEIDVRESC